MKPLLSYSLLALACCLLGSKPADTLVPNRLGKDFALFFAVDKYKNSAWTDLRNPVRDAEAIATELQTHFGFETEIHRNPTRSQIREVILGWQQKAFDKDAQLFIFFSGHGAVSEFDNEGYFMPTDADRVDKNHFSLLSLRRAVNQIPCPHILLAVDACYSGTILEKGDPVYESEPKRRGETDETRRQRMIQHALTYPSRYILTSGGRERTLDGEDHSPFTEGILKSLRQSNQGDGILLWLQLASQMRKEVHPMPRIGTFRGHAEGGFVFVRSEREENNFPDEKLTSSEAFLYAVECGTIACFEGFLREFNDSEDPYVKLAQNQLKDLRANSPSPLSNPAFVSENPDDLIPLPEMVPIQGGRFMMGNEKGAFDEKPVHPVEISGFYISRTEVTVEQFCAFLNVKGNQKYGGKSWLKIPNRFIEINSDSSSYVPKLDATNFSVAKFPVVEVTWYGAKAYCEWLSEWSGEYFRLPTEAEWEYVAGGGTMNRTQWAGTNNQNELRFYANMKYIEGGDYFNHIAPVGSFRANVLGIQEMSGNIWEWCGDHYDSKYYDLCLNAKIIQDPINTYPSKKVIIRGGGFLNEDPISFQVSHRSRNSPNNRATHIGFRVAKSN